MWRESRTNLTYSAAHACQANTEPLHAGSIAFFRSRADRSMNPATLCKRTTDNTPLILEAAYRCGRQTKDLPSCIRRAAKDPEYGLRCREQHSFLLSGLFHAWRVDLGSSITPSVSSRPQGRRVCLVSSWHRMHHLEHVVLGLTGSSCAFRHRMNPASCIVSLHCFTSC
jgi:hypothetical protein